jgi:hypothetical protein
MPRDREEGPPWGTTVDPDEAYLRGQAGQAGSGLLSGQSQAWYGGAVETPKKLQAEVRRTIAEMARKRLTAPSR